MVAADDLNVSKSCITGNYGIFLLLGVRQDLYHQPSSSKSGSLLGFPNGYKDFCKGSIRVVL